MLIFRCNLRKIWIVTMKMRIFEEDRRKKEVNSKRSQWIAEINSCIEFTSDTTTLILTQMQKHNAILYAEGNNDRSLLIPI
jgi:hypothetical protein